MAAFNVSGYNVHGNKSKGRGLLINVKETIKCKRHMKQIWIKLKKDLPLLFFYIDQ